MEGEYTLGLHCQNCGDLAQYTIPKGTRVSSVECDNCGLKSLRREAWVNKKIRGQYLSSGLEDKEDDDEEDL